MSVRISKGCVALVAFLAGACAQGDRAGRAGLGPTVMDSAGVQIVINRIPADGLPVYATVDSVPDLDLGFEPGDSTSYLRDVKGAVTLSNGDVVVADGGSFQARYYGPGGTWLGWMGEQGFDPGEYWDLARLGRWGGDTLWTADHTLDRLTVFERAAGLVSTHELPADHSVAGRFGDGSFLVVPRWSVQLHAEDPVDGVRRDPARYLRWWPGSGDTVGVGVFAHDETVVVETDHGMSLGVPPFGRKTVQAVGPGRFYVGDQERFVIDGYDPDGTLRQSIRLVGRDRTLRPEELVAARRKLDRENAPPVADAFWAAVTTTRPAFSRLLLDAAGSLWVAEDVAGDDAPRTWTVFAPDGAVRGLVVLPEGVAVQEIGVAHVLGVVRTPGGDQRVLRYRLTPRRGAVG